MSTFYMIFIDVPNEFNFAGLTFQYSYNVINKKKLGGSDLANNGQFFVHIRIKTQLNKSENVFIPAK